MFPSSRVCLSFTEHHPRRCLHDMGPYIDLILTIDLDSTLCTFRSCTFCLKARLKPVSTYLHTLPRPHTLLRLHHVGYPFQVWSTTSAKHRHSTCKAKSKGIANFKQLQRHRNSLSHWRCELRKAWKARPAYGPKYCCHCSCCTIPVIWGKSDLSICLPSVHMISRKSFSSQLFALSS